ncbi:MAG: S9 family peptidase [Acidobacteriota bacterium]|nr:MAG: S9 family peptidase [Acidobacteriota bacterium]
MRNIRLIAIVLLAASSVLAQDKLITLDDIFNPDAGKRVRFSGTPAFVQWAADGRSFRQMVGGRLMRVDAVTGQRVPYYDVDSFVAALTRAGVSADEARAIANSPSLKFNPDDTAILINHKNDVWHFDVAGRVVKRLTNNKDEEKEADFSPDGKWVSFVRNNDLFVVEVATGNEKQLTRDGAEKIFNGYLVWVYEEELYGRGNNRGYWWSPDSQRIAFLRLDESKVPKFVMANDIPIEQVVETTPYPKAGDPNPTVKLGIADINKTSFLPNTSRIPRVGRNLPASVRRLGDAVKFVDIDKYKPEDLLIARVAWTPDASSVVYQALNREQTFLDLNAADMDGKAKKLLEEQTPAWVEVYDNPMFLADGSFVWQSARSGWKHIYHYDAAGRLKRQLTDGKWEVRDVYGVDERGGWVYFSGTKDSHIAVNVYRVPLAGGEPQRLTPLEGWNTASFNKTFTHFVHNFSNISTPPQTRLLRADGSLERVINENKVDLLNDYKISPPEFLNVSTRDGFQMEAMIIKPPDFDPTQKYPVFQFTYAGPHAPQVANRWGGNRGLWFQMLAQKGYIIWVCDNRTASGKGEESVWPAYKRLGELELRDLEDSVAYLKTLPYVDGDRIGLFGWSYGGFMTSFAMTRSKTWKMGIAGGSVTDWRLYDSIYTERYMLTPQNNAEGYDRTSVVKAAKNLHGKLLLIHGVMDDNVHMQNTTQLAYELQRADKQFDLMLYPTQRHGISNPALVKHWYTMMTDFIYKNL